MMIRTNVHVSKKQLDALKAIAAHRGLTYAELIRRAIDMLLRKEGKPWFSPTKFHDC